MHASPTSILSLHPQVASGQGGGMQLPPPSISCSLMIPIPVGCTGILYGVRKGWGWSILGHTTDYCVSDISSIAMQYTDGRNTAPLWHVQVEQQISIKLVEAIQKYHITNKQTDLDDAVEGMQKAVSGRD